MTLHQSITIFLKENLESIKHNFVHIGLFGGISAGWGQKSKKSPSSVCEGIMKDKHSTPGQAHTSTQEVAANFTDKFCEVNKQAAEET